MRSRSRRELRLRLLRAGYEPEEIDLALDDLEAVGLVDDDRFAQELAAHQVERRHLGRRGAVASLRRAGIAPDVAERALAELATDDEEERATELARRRLSRLAGLDERMAYRRLLGFLQRRGYDGETARAACRRALEDGEAS